MKYNKLFALMLFAGFTLATACGKDEPKNQTPEPKQEKQEEKEPKKPVEKPNPENPKDGDKPKDGKDNPPAGGNDGGKGGDDNGSNPGGGDKPNNGGGSDNPNGGSNPGNGGSGGDNGGSPQNPGGGGNPTPPTDGTVENEPSTVLIMTFAGLKSNSYNALQDLKRTVESRGDRVVGVIMHSKYAESRDLYTEEAESYFNDIFVWGNLPQTSYNGQKTTVKTLESRLAEHDLIKADVRVNRSEDNLTVTLQATARKGHESKLAGRNLNWIAWLVEDNVYVQQENAYGSVRTYETDGVFRARFDSGIWGEAYTLGQTATKSGAISAKVVNKDNARLVVVIVDRATKEVLDVTRVTL